MKSIIVAICAATLVSGAAAAKNPTIVVSPTPLPSETVSFADLNLGSPAGQLVLQRRIHSAAGRVCFVDGDRSIDNYMLSNRCFKAALADGLNQMNTAIANRDSGTGLAAATLIIRAH